LSANRGGWFGNNHFLETNEYLVKNNMEPIHWV
jgi:uracil-DNA glycosylase